MGLVNQETNNSVDEFLDGVDNQVRRSDAIAVIDIMKEVTGEEPKIWGKSIIAFGKVQYKRKNGDEFEWFRVGLSPAKAHLSVYLMQNLKEEVLLNELGPHKNGSSCLYIKKLEQVDKGVLRKLIEKSISASDHIGHQ